MKHILNAAIFALLAAGACSNKAESQQEGPQPVKTAQGMPQKPAAPAVPAQAAASPCKALDSLPEDKRPKILKDAKLEKAAEGSAALSLPAPGAPSDGETHTRHAWRLPRNASNAVAVVRWADTTWGDVKLALGTGICPHRGVELASAVSSTGLAVVHYEHSPDRARPEPDWFLHVNADAALQTKGGEELKYDYEICVY